jgi:hypothetical protein
LESVAEATGLSVQRDAPAALLASLPPVDHPGVRIRAQLPFGGGWKVDRYSPDDLQWRSATFDDATRASGSLFRFAFRHQRYVLYCERGSAFHIPGQVGKYLALKRRRRQVLRYDAETRLLSAPASCRPPFLVERALILCSGTLPAYDGEARGGILRYSAIPDRIASLVAALLRQEFR